LAICIVDQAGAVVLQTQIPADKQLLLQALAPFRPDVGRRRRVSVRLVRNSARL
jgi:hypothetical protein